MATHHAAVANWFDDQSWVTHHWWDVGAERELAKARKRARGSSHPRGAIVAELPFGCWRQVIGARYQQSFWRSALDAAFPSIPGDTREDRRQNLEDHLIVLNKLRNRLSHHEPICRSWKFTLTALRAEQNRMYAHCP